MKALITLSSLRKLTASTKGQTRQFLWDTKLYMFGAYRTSRGDVVFVYQFRMHPSQPTERMTLGKLGPLTPDQARTLASTAALKVANGINPIAERREALRKVEVDESMLLKNFAQHYLAVRVDERKLRSAKDIRATIEKDICSHLGECSIAEITVLRVEKMMQILGQRSPSSPRHALVQLKAMLAYAKRTNRIDRVLIDGLIPPKSNTRVRMLSPTELRRFIEAIHDLGGPRGDIYMCLLLLMKRLREVSRMVWKEIDQQNWIWLLPDERSKNKTAQTIILPPRVVRILERQQPDPNLRQGRVFSLDGKSFATLGTKMKERRRSRRSGAKAGNPRSRWA